MLCDHEEGTGEDGLGSADVESVVGITSSTNYIAQTSLVGTLFPSSLTDQFLKTLDINASSIVAHRFRAFRQYFCLSVLVREMETCQQRSSLNFR